MATGEYTLTEEHYRRLERNVLVGAIFVIVLVAAWSLYTTRREGRDPAVSGVVIVFVMGVVGFSMYRANKRQQAQARSFRLTLGGDTLARTQDGFDPVTIRAGEVGSIRWTPGQGLAIRGSNGETVLSIPETLERFADLRGALESWRPIEEAPRPNFLIRWRWSATIATLGALAAVNFSDNPAVVLPVGVALVLAMIISLVLMQSSTEIDRRTKRLSWVSLFVVAQIVGRMVVVARLARLW